MNIIIVGASSGLGLAVAEILAAQGHRLALAARSIAPLQALQQRYPGQIIIDSIDITATDAANRFESFARQLGTVDVYLHAAGIGCENPELLPETEARIINTNANGFATMIGAAFRLFQRQGHGHIAAITSVAATKGIGTMAAYSATKRFNQTYLDALSQLSTLRHLNITFTDIRPGWTDTPLLGHGAKYPLKMPAERVAHQIVKAITHRRRVATIDWRWQLLVAAWRLLPTAIWRRLPLNIRFPGKA